MQITHPIKRFEIKNLYDERDVSIEFDSNIKIVVAENGFGKTTVLNAFYSLLAGEIDKLKKIAFESIIISFTDGESVTLEKESIAFDLSTANKSGMYRHLRSILSDNDIYNLIQLQRAMPLAQLRRHPSFMFASKKFDIDHRTLQHWLRMLADEITGKLPEVDKIKSLFEKIRSKFDLNILYLPTYRRVEEELLTLGIYDESESPRNNQINFGMDDVKERIKSITSEILSSSVEWFSKVNGEMISQLVEGFEVNDEMLKSVQRQSDIKIVLDRIGDNIQPKNKEHILNLVKTGQISTGHEPLVYFLSNLVKVYEQQKENDAAIQDFTNVCNEYLVDKKISYNESNVTISIIRKKNSKPVDWQDLSSGEKQIVSLFARLYLDKSENLAIFFDEPELSLSIEWQRKLLPHIVKSEKCKFLFCTTHSPFIFENELDYAASDLSYHMKEL